jgi:phenylalanine-4-hydroxylase
MLRRSLFPRCCASSTTAVPKLSSCIIPPFARSEKELDLLEQKTLAAGAELQDDPKNPHPGFHDETYKKRRRDVCEQGMKYRSGEPVPYLEYTPQENETWATIWDKLIELYPTHACRQFNENIKLLQERAGYGRNAVPQLRDINNFLLPRSGFNVRPVAGLLSARDFFNGLALRTFYSTQYIRHHSQPLYTPEPDVVHELMGHVPLFADKDFADFSQIIGLAAMGAPDHVVEQLSRCYWYSVEFGLAREGGKLKAYGAGLLSSFGELGYCLTDEPKVLNWDPFDAAKREFPITKYQPIYYAADSFKDAQSKMKEFIGQLDLPHRVEFDWTSRTLTAIPKVSKNTTTTKF